MSRPGRKVVFLATLDRVEDDVASADHAEWALTVAVVPRLDELRLGQGERRKSAKVQRVVEHARDGRNIRLGKRPAVRQDGKGEMVSALVLFVVGQSRRAQERKSQRAVLARMTVLAVVEQGDAVAELGDVCEAMPADFELRSVPSRVAVRRPLDEAELILVRAVRGRCHLSCAIRRGDERHV